MSVMSPEDFADFFESHEKDSTLSQEWMEWHIEKGKVDAIEESATILAKRYGASHKYVLRFRSMLQAASEKVTGEKLTIAKSKDAGMFVRPNAKHTKPAVSDVQLVINALAKLHKRGVSVSDIEEGVSSFFASLV